MSDKELEPCPFCGSTDVGGANGIVHCYSCKASTGGIDTSTAVAKWNTRSHVDVDQPALDDIEIDQLKARVAELENGIRTNAVCANHIDFTHQLLWAEELLNRKHAASLLLYEAYVIDRLYDKYDQDNCNDYDWCVKDFLIGQAEELRKQANEAKS